MGKTLTLFLSTDAHPESLVLFKDRSLYVATAFATRLGNVPYKQQLSIDGHSVVSLPWLMLNFPQKANLLDLIRIQAEEARDAYLEAH